MELGYEKMITHKIEESEISEIECFLKCNSIININNIDSHLKVCEKMQVNCIHC